MDGFKEVFAGELTSKRDKSVLFYDELTLNRSKIADCAFDPLGSFHDREVWFDLYKSKTTGELIFPYQQKVYWGCGICYWNISFESDEINKDFYEEMYSPVDIIVSIGDEKEVINYSDLEFFESIGVGFLDDKGLRMEGYR
jgi:hypothetical protein